MRRNCRHFECMSRDAQAQLRHSRQQGARIRGEQSNLVESVKVQSIGGQVLNCCSEFRYLGTILTANAQASREVDMRRSRAQIAFSTLRQVWRANALTLGTKTALYNTLILSILLYNLEVASLRPKDLERLEGFHNRCSRLIGLKSISLTNILRQRRLMFVGHVARMQADDPMQMAVLTDVSEMPRNADARNGWTKLIHEDLACLRLSGAAGRSGRHGNSRTPTAEDRSLNWVNYALDCGGWTILVAATSRARL